MDPWVKFDGKIFKLSSVGNYTAFQIGGGGPHQSDFQLKFSTNGGTVTLPEYYTTLADAIAAIEAKYRSREVIELDIF